MSFSMHAFVLWGVRIDDPDKARELVEGREEALLSWGLRLEAYSKNMNDPLCDRINGILIGYPLFSIWSGEPVPLGRMSFRVNPSWRRGLALYLERMGLPWTEPGWHGYVRGC